MTLLAMAGMNMAQDIYSTGYYYYYDYDEFGEEVTYRIGALYKNGSKIADFFADGEGTDVLVTLDGKVYCAFNYWYEETGGDVEEYIYRGCVYNYTDNTYLLDRLGAKIYAIYEGNNGTIYSFGAVYEPYYNDYGECYFWFNCRYIWCFKR